MIRDFEHVSPFFKCLILLFLDRLCLSTIVNETTNNLSDDGGKLKSMARTAWANQYFIWLSNPIDYKIFASCHCINALFDVLDPDEVLPKVF